MDVWLEGVIAVHQVELVRLHIDVPHVVSVPIQAIRGIESKVEVRRLLCDVMPIGAVHRVEFAEAK